MIVLAKQSQRQSSRRAAACVGELFCRPLPLARVCVFVLCFFPPPPLPPVPARLSASHRFLFISPPHPLGYALCSFALSLFALLGLPPPRFSVTLLLYFPLSLRIRPQLRFNRSLGTRCSPPAETTFSTLRRPCLRSSLLRSPFISPRLIVFVFNVCRTLRCGNNS